MFKIQLSGLILLTELQVEYTLEACSVVHKKERWWKLDILTNKDGLKDSGTLYTSKNEPRYFKQLNSLVEFIEENKLSTKHLLVKLNTGKK